MAETTEVKTVNGEETKKEGIKDKFVNSKPVSFVRRHAKGFAAGAAGLAAVGAAAVVAAKAAKDGVLEAPFDIGEEEGGIENS